MLQEEACCRAAAFLVTAYMPHLDKDQVALSLLDSLSGVVWDLGAPRRASALRCLAIFGPVKSRMLTELKAALSLDLASFLPSDFCLFIDPGTLFFVCIICRKAPENYFPLSSFFLMFKCPNIDPTVCIARSCYPVTPLISAPYDTE